MSSNRCAVLTCAIAFFAAKAGLAEADSKFVIASEKAVAQLSQAEWSMRWWQWAASFDYSESPVADRTGELCAQGQQGPVWFLAGVYGSAPVKRTCEVPAGKFLFFPIVNFIAFPRATVPLECDDVTATALTHTDEPSDLAVFVNGEPVENLIEHRQASVECFDLGARSGERVYPAASNGYYVMLKPLPPGRHEVKWGGVLPTLRQAVIYVIDVKDVASSAL